MVAASLKKNCLGFPELLAQAIALISPTMTAALIIPVMYSNTGDWSWLSYALGTVMLLFVALNLNQFARRSTSSGSMYAYISRGLGLTAGGIGGWSLIWAYLGISMAGVTGFTIFAGKLLAMIGISVPPIALFALCVGLAWLCAWKDVRLSAVLMLALEGASVTLILILCFITLGNHGFALDRQQFDVSALPWSKLGLGVVVAIFSLVGFECATAFGDEAKDPLKSIPRAVWLSLVISGAFFIFVTYTMVMAVRGYATPLDQIDAPLNVMAVLAHVPVLQAPISRAAARRRSGNRDRPERERGQRRHLIREPPGGLIAVAGHRLAEGRDEGRRESALGEQIAQQIRNAECGRERVHRSAAAEQRRENLLAREPEHATAHDREPDDAGGLGVELLGFLILIRD